ncbi:hypothetical protein CLOSTASPAR_01066 [[Clostridium] asparagiforme DSM 15981]|uniref:Uncharacterized protein n=1 Tax=[Clostridium] asparagiforme DSM 15981 TaxID=518636 RepID=C0CVR3_9FIRM|nr:hypothetical protein CLOSTASPAR_01066 [[Clostridium] asparagiforme DSM 15981]
MIVHDYLGKDERVGSEKEPLKPCNKNISLEETVERYQEC